MLASVHGLTQPDIPESVLCFPWSHSGVAIECLALTVTRAREDGDGRPHAQEAFGLVDRWHSLLRRQMEQLFGSAESVPASVLPLLDAVSEAYARNDEERASMDRTLDSHSHELLAANAELRRVGEALRRARDEAEKSSRAKSEFLATMSHELRTPLSAILGYSELLLEDAHERGQSGTVSDLERIRAAGQHVLALVSEVLDLSKVEAGKMELAIEPVDLASIVRDVVAMAEPLVRKNGNRLVVSAPDVPGSIRSDALRLRQVLFNLLSNAAKFTERGTVTFALAGDATWATFAVSDTGIGMTPAQMERLFQPYAQADTETTRRYGGTGLGLSLSRRICEMLGGDLTVSSVYGQGSTFCARLPVATSAPRDDR